MIRAQSRLLNQDVATPSPSVIATNVDGETRRTKPLVTREVWPIRRVFQSGSNWAVQLQTRPAKNPTSLSVRITGINEVTRARHDLDGTWAVTPDPTDPTIFIATGSTWVPDQTFICGFAFVEGKQIEATRELAKLFKWCEQYPGGIIELPVGGLYAKDLMTYIPDGWSVVGAGRKSSFFFKADYVSDDTYINQVLRTGNPSDSKRKNVNSVTWRGFSIFGNPSRAKPIDPNTFAYQGGGAVAFGADLLTDSSDNILTLTIEYFGVYGSGGYATYFSGDNTKKFLTIRDSEFMGSSSDGLDFKDRWGLNTDILIERCRIEWFGMGDSGTNRNPVWTMPNNPLVTVAGTTRCKLLKSINDRTRNLEMGEVVNLKNGTSGDGIDPTGSFYVVAQDPTYVYLEMGQTVTAGDVAIGGNAMTCFAPHISPADSGIDVRGIHVRVDTVHLSAPLFGIHGFRQRPEGGYNAGQGGKYVTFQNCTVTDLSPPWVANTTNRGEAMALHGEGAMVSGLRVTTQTGATGIAILTTGTKPNIGDCHLVGCGIGIDVAGEDVKIHDTRIENPRDVGIYIYGDKNRPLISLPANGFVPASIGSNVVIIPETIGEHGLSNGDTVFFVRVVNSNNGLVILNRAQGNGTIPYYTVTVLSPTSLSFEATGSATNTNAFGGEFVDMRWEQAAPHIARNIEIDGVTLTRTGEDTAIGIHVVKGTGDPQSVGVVVQGSRMTGFGEPLRDLVTDTIWGPGNSGQLPNLQRTVLLDAAGGSRTLTREDSGNLYILPGSAADDYTLNLPDPAHVPAGWSVDVVSDSNNSSNGIIVTTPSGNILYGTGTATSLTSTTRSAHGRIVRRASTGGYALIMTGGTWS